MENRYLILIILLCITFGIFMGFVITAFGEFNLMKNYDLYNCIYNNADSNNFNQNFEMIKKIQDECICFREHNYTNLLGKC